MKKFKISMAKPDTSDIVCEYQGVGAVSFPVKEPDIDVITDYRGKCVEKFQELGQGASDIEAFNATYKMRLKLIQLALDIKDVTDEQAAVILARSGGINGPLILELITRYGVDDIFEGKKDKGGNLEVEIPT